MFYMAGPIYRPADIIGRYWPIVDISVSVNISPDIKYKNDAGYILCNYIVCPAIIRAQTCNKFNSEWKTNTGYRVEISSLP